MKTVKLLIVVLVMTYTLSLKAQEKYEYAIAVYKVRTLKVGELSISRDGNYSETEVNVTGKAPEDLSPLVEAVNKMSLDGWEVYNTSAVANNNLFRTYYFLRKKKN